MTAIPDLRVHVRGLDSTQFKGRCTDLDADDTEVRALVEFQGNAAPAISLGQMMKLSFRGGGLVANIDTDGLATARVDDQSRRQYSFTLEGVPKELLLVLANRRHAPRVKRDDPPVHVRLLHPENVPSAGKMQDLSLGGLSVVLRREAEERLADTVAVQLEVSLPDGEPALVLEATIRYRKLCAASVLYGMQFDWQKPEFAYAQHRIARHLASIGAV